MASVQPVKVTVAVDRNPIKIQCSESCTAEELCIILCKKYKIPPLTRTLFALRVRGTNNFLKDNSKVVDRTRDYELRIRYKVPKLEHLYTQDENTFDYYFRQARNDVNENKVPEIKYPEHKDELLGLGILDMTRAVLEEKLPRKDVENNYKKYVPKEVVKKHGLFLKKYAHEYLGKLSVAGHSCFKLKTYYLKELYALAPNYLAEEYDNVMWKANDKDLVSVRLVVAPFDPQKPGIKMYSVLDRKWTHVCTIEELVYLTRNSQGFLEVSRRGTPFFFKFANELQMSSFISACDGCYRLMVKWTFNLSKDDETPSLKELHRMRCHGPVGGAFSYRKLDEKRGKAHGSYILRQCQDEYNVYYLDVCTINRTTETYRLEYLGHCWLFNNVEYCSLEELVREHQKPDERIFLKERIPPSEYDKSQLLLCGEPQRTGVRVEQEELQNILKDNRSPRCLPNKDILLYTGSEKASSEDITITYKALWKLDEIRKLTVAFKTLQKDKANNYLKDFIDLANKWACVQSSSIVRLYGITLSSPTALVLEYLPWGPFDVYLKKHSESVKDIHLLKACAGLARALWDLSECGVVHGDIRCRRLLLAAADADRVQVKLSGPTLRQYTPHDVHWIPVDFYGDMNMARKSVLGDIWAFATTIWEIFSLGQSPADMNPVLTKRSYEKGDRLPRPARCPRDVWSLALDCWASEALALRPQAIMRDMNYLLHTEYEPSNIHTYEAVNVPGYHLDLSQTITTDKFSELSDAGSHKSLLSTDSSVPSTNGVNDFDNNSLDNYSASSFENRVTAVMGGRFQDSATDDGGGVAGGGGGGGAVCAAADAQPSLMESIVSRGVTYLVTKTARIGGGTYGEVYKGWMESDCIKSVRRVVAIKVLKSKEMQFMFDFKNEREIMKNLQHPNIVEILGSSENGPHVQIVMEYLEEGSLNHYLKFKKDKLHIKNLLKYALDVAMGMDHISSKNIVHRDLATRNILVVNVNHVKISDFGLARKLVDGEKAYKLQTSRFLPYDWYAPESVKEKQNIFSSYSDVWSYGVTMWEIFSYAKEVPKFNPKQDPDLRASNFTIPDKCPSDIFKQLMVDCWALTPTDRPEFIELVHRCKRLQQRSEIQIHPNPCVRVHLGLRT